MAGGIADRAEETARAEVDNQGGAMLKRVQDTCVNVD